MKGGENMSNKDFEIEVITLDTPKVDISDVQLGCWGDDGTDWSNTCKM